MVDGRTHFGDGIGRYINGSLTGIKSNVRLGRWNDKQKGFPVVTKKPVKKGGEFILSYGVGYWNALRSSKKSPRK